MGERFGSVLGLVLCLLLLVWLLFSSRWSDVEGQGGFFFRLGVVVLPYLFAWGTLRSGFRLPTRIASFAWMALVLVVAFVLPNPSRDGKGNSSGFRAGFVERCQRTARVSESICGCAADAYLQTHTGKETEDVTRALGNDTLSEEFKSWARGAIAECQSGGPPTVEEATSAVPAATPEQAGPLKLEVAKTTCHLTSQPPGARITIDGERTDKTTPADVTLYAGRNNVVQVELAGHLTDSVAIIPDLNQATSHDFALRRGGLATLLSRPAGAEVFENGELLARTPAIALPMAEGQHQLTFRRPDHVEVEKTLDVSDSPLELSVELQEAARVHVKSFPSGASISVDGKPSATTTPATLLISPNELHFLTATVPGLLATTERTRALEAGDTEEMTIALSSGDDQERREHTSSTKRRIKSLEQTVARLTKVSRSGAPSKRARAEKERIEAQRELDARRTELDAELPTR